MPPATRTTPSSTAAHAGLAPFPVLPPPPFPQADILGIFGREGLDLATRWVCPGSTTPTYQVGPKERLSNHRCVAALLAHARQPGLSKH